MRIALAALLLAPALALAADAPAIVVAHQGRLLDGANNPVTGQLDLTFSLYLTHDTQTDRAALWSETYSVSVENGTYGVLLGDRLGDNAAKKVLTADVFDSTAWLSVKIDTVELSPRLRLGTTPYAATAHFAARAGVVAPDGVDTAALQDGSVTLAKLALADGRFADLDADLLDGLDSSAFAPAAIQGDVTAIKESVGPSAGADLAAVKATTGTIASDVEALKTGVDGLGVALGAAAGDLGAIKSSVGSSAGTDIAALKTGLGTAGADIAAVKAAVGESAGADIGATKTAVAASATEIAALKASVAKLLSRANYSKDCSDFGSNGWDSKEQCLRDGRWHWVGTIAKYGETIQGGFKPGTLNDHIVSGCSVKLSLANTKSYITPIGTQSPNADNIRFTFPYMTNSSYSSNFLHWTASSSTTELYFGNDYQFDYSGPDGWGFHTGWSRTWTGRTNIPERIDVWCQW